MLSVSPLERVIPRAAKMMSVGPLTASPVASSSSSIVQTRCDSAAAAWDDLAEK